MTLEEIISNTVWAQHAYAVAQKQAFLENRNQAEENRIRETLEWTPQKRQDDWPTLLDHLAQDYAPYGLQTDFYVQKFTESAENLQGIYWEKLIEDWAQANRAKLSDDLQKQTETQEEGTKVLLQRTLKSVPDYLEQHKVPMDEFVQVWGTMSGRWNSVDFERMRSVVHIQEKYPILLTVAQKMGRIASEESILRFAVTSGNTQQMEHSNKSDIRGITTGNNLNLLLPLELAQSADEELSDLFLYKYATQGLQNFSNRSEVQKPARSLQIKPAKQKGPMIICLDTSGSMSGQPELIGQSMLVKLLELADSQSRDMYLIAFSVSVNPIDVRKERARLQEFFTKTSIGDTDPTKMIEKSLVLLEQKPEYMSADVLWISDFKMQLPRESLLERLQKHRKEGTCLYGLRTALAADRVWEPYFDAIYDIAIPHFRKYGK